MIAMVNQRKFDWAQAVLELALAEDSSLPTLAQAAGLDPIAGDVSHLDLRDIDLQNQNLSGWNLSETRLERCRLQGCDLRGARIPIDQLVLAEGWSEAILDEGTREKAYEAEYAMILHSEIWALLGVRRSRVLSVTAEEFFSRHHILLYGRSHVDRWLDLADRFDKLATRQERLRHRHFYRSASVTCAALYKMFVDDPGSPIREATFERGVRDLFGGEVVKVKYYETRSLAYPDPDKAFRAALSK